jgi:hypothetical protein
MNGKIGVVLALSMMGLVVACGTEGTDDASPSSEEALSSSAKSKLVGSYVDNADDVSVSVPFYAIQIRKNGTYHATGGCKPSSTPGAANCFAITETDGTWAADGTKLTLIDQNDVKTTLYYGWSGADLYFGLTPGGTQVLFQKQGANVVHPGGMCKLGDKCSKGYECRSNCPKDAECFATIYSCQPQVKVITGGGFCSIDAGSPPCEAGYECTSTCPPGADCYLPLFQCTKK